MAERRGRPGVAVLVGLGTLVLAGVGGFLSWALIAFLDSGSMDAWDVSSLVVGVVGGVGSFGVLVSGGWAAWRLGQGRSPAAAGLVEGTLVVTAVVSLVGLVGSSPHCDFMNPGDCETTNWGAVAVSQVPAALFLPWGLLRARRVARGRSRDNWGSPLRKREPVAVRPTWLVAEPGALLTGHIIGEDEVARLGAGTVVTEVRRTGSRVLVTGPYGLTGWVDANRLEPTDAGAGEGGGDG